MIGVVQVGGQAYADRYTYFPSLGIGFAVSLCLAEAVGRARLPRPAVMLAGSALLAALGVATWRQTLVWRNTVGLFEHAIAATGRNPFIRLQLAEEFVKNNEFQRAEEMVQQSLADVETRHAVRIVPVDLLMSIQTAISMFYDREHREDDALRQIDTALVVQPNNWEMLVSRGFFLAKLGREAEAVAVLEQAIALEKGNNPQQLELARRTLAAARRRLAGGESPDAAPR
jgi:tetratricopeptide (TPR) repeat protein